LEYFAFKCAQAHNTRYETQKEKEKEAGKKEKEKKKPTFFSWGWMPFASLAGLSRQSHGKP